MAKTLTVDQVKEYYDQISVLPLQITKLKYWELVEVWQYAKNKKQNIADEIDRLITLTPDYLGYPANVISENDKFDYWALRYNAGQYQKAKKVYDFACEELYKAKKFKKAIGLTDYLKKHGSEPYFQFTDNIKTADIVLNPEKTLKEQGYSVMSVILAYYYLKEKEIYPIIELKTATKTTFYHKLADSSGFTFDVIRTNWPKTRLVSNRTKKNNSKNIAQSIILLKQFKTIDTQDANTLAVSELNKAK